MKLLFFSNSLVEKKWSTSKMTKPTKRIRTTLKQRLPFIEQYLFGIDTARNIGKKIIDLGLTNIRTYACCGNSIGQLTVYQ
jgi:hypothetical protein